MAAPPCTAHCFSQASARPKLAAPSTSHMMSPMLPGQQTACRLSWRGSEAGALCAVVHSVVALKTGGVQPATGRQSANVERPGAAGEACCACRRRPAHRPSLADRTIGRAGHLGKKTFSRVPVVRKPSYSPAFWNCFLWVSFLGALGCGYPFTCFETAILL